MTFARICLTVILPFSSWIPVSASAADTASAPNVLVILADDLGRGEYSAFGTKDIRTPHIDRLFREGMSCDNFFANSCVCSPTRAALLTGCYPDRVGVPGVIRDVERNSWGHLSQNAVLLPKLLKPAGYHTAIVGKWHLGLESPNTPLDRGFDFFHGFLGDMMDDYVTHRRGGENYMRYDREIIDPAGHATDLFTEWACQAVRARAAAGQPFFLYLAYNAPHGPLQPTQEWLERVRKREPQLTGNRLKLVALIEHMDEGIGRVLQAVEQAGASQNTLIIFTSDNGGPLGAGSVNGPHRSGKTHMYEGGLRVPFAAYWPGTIAPGRASGRQALTMDLFPTIAEAAGLPAPEGIDGVSFLPTLLGKEQAEADRDVYFVYREGGPYLGRQTQAVRKGDWKLVLDDPFGPAELFNLKADPKETTNVAGRERAVFNRLAGLLRAHTQRAGAVPWRPPSPRPD